MAALANEVARLVRALHGTDSKLKTSLSSGGGYIEEPLWQVNDASEACCGRQRCRQVGPETMVRGAQWRWQLARGEDRFVPDDSMVAAADRAARVWAADVAGPIAPGSEAHKAAFCYMLLDTHNPYRPSIIDWPELDLEARGRLVGLPIWDIAVRTEGKARLRVLSYGEAITDPLLRQAIELVGFEEGRHKEVLSNLVQAYGIRLAPEPEYHRPRDPEWAFMVTGFSECIDSVFAFGLFALAKRSGFFPPALVDTFEPVMQEEGRHILFFVNWVAWHRRNLPLWRRPIFWAKIFGVWAFLIWERIGLARGFGGAGDGEGGMASQDNNFTLTGSKSVSAADLSVKALIDVCLAENDRRLSGYDRRLLRPTVMPCLLRFVRRFLPRSDSRAAVS